MLSKELVLTELLYEAVIQLWKQEGWCAGPQTLVLGSLEELGELAAEILVTECFDFTPSHHKPNVQECRAKYKTLEDSKISLARKCHNRLKKEVPEVDWDFIVDELRGYTHYITLRQRKDFQRLCRKLEVKKDGERSFE